ncbi:hypothetical protein [Leptolyngbya sp. KIOST-1]|nr:hypothetical protein [Leptolyngbya sp. KIOST-1]
MDYDLYATEDEMGDRLSQEVVAIANPNYSLYPALRRYDGQ